MEYLSSARWYKTCLSLLVKHYADLCLLVTALLWGINIPVVKYAVTKMDALSFNALRMLLSTTTLGLILWLEVLWMRKRASAETEENKPDSKLINASVSDWIPVVIFSLLSGLFYPLAFMHGIDRTTAGNTALLLATMPVWTALLSRLFLKEKLLRLTWFGLLVTFVGTALIIQAKGSVDLTSVYFVGNLLILLGAMIWASATVISTPLLKRISPLKLAFVSALLTTPIHVGMNFAMIARQWTVWTQSSVLACTLYSGILSTGVAYATWHYGVRRLGGSHSAVYQNVVTMVAVMLSWMVLGEPVLVLQIVGGAIAIVGLFILRRSRR